ncbi:response regulator transcription factor [Actinoplanes sp. TRM 88003]|uniref:Response regulator transcription factor n=1 Tax=Paractinoplanes aksuensis TaxID=2939490 RepID=A0ABT1DUF2_9ACTN|nr:response regulator transcription factor [Actinoplanes aksuensis]MCO8273666.1 response regulator transcription factor [Actinoplanes aksuensis]
MIRVVVVDDHPVFRKGLVALLRASEIEVVAEAASGREAIEVVGRERPDVVLMDLGLPELGGVAATEHIVAAYGPISVVAITMYDDEQSVAAALAAGASGYVVKDSEPDQIVAAIRATLSGALWLGAGVPRPGFAPASEAVRALGGGPWRFTPREDAIARLLAKGLANPVIAERLGLSAKTVANYVSGIITKVGAADRAEATRLIRDPPGPEPV